MLEPDTEPTIADALRTLREAEAADAPAPAEIDGLDFTAIAQTPAPGTRMTNSTWRILEEQRLTALEIVAEIDAQIATLTAKRKDALRAAAMCEAGQKGMS